VRIGPRVDQLHVDPHAIAGPLHATFENGLDVESRGDLQDGQRGIAELLDRRARDDRERADPR